MSAIGDLAPATGHFVTYPKGTLRRDYVRNGDLIGIGAAVARGPLPHHRAYGSVHGGSSQLR
jgi:hypothetical protein